MESDCNLVAVIFDSCAHVQLRGLIRTPGSLVITADDMICEH